MKETDPDILGGFDPDTPQTDPAKDLLGYRKPAARLAEQIASMPLAHGYVIGVYGPWGSGKTTFLNFLTYSLKPYVRRGTVRVVSFNPWCLSRPEDTVGGLIERIDASIRTAGQGWKDIRRKIHRLGKALSTTAMPFRFWSSVLEEWGLDNRDLLARKTDLGRALEKNNRRILVVLDDLDRLSAPEVREVFRTIKAVADFPRTIYLVACDRSVVVTALQDQQNKGDEYLEKIVQIEFHLPMIDKPTLLTLLTQRLDVLFRDSPDALFDNNAWLSLYINAITPLLRTPRDIARVTNHLNIAYVGLRGEVNVVDFIGLGVLAVFIPSLYQIVRGNRDRFAGVASDPRISDRQHAEEKAFHEGWYKDLDVRIRPAAKAILSHLFPRYNDVLDGRSGQTSDLSGWRRALRACSPDIFDIYFQGDVSAGRVSAGEVRAALSTASDVTAFSSLLLTLANEHQSNGLTRARAFLQRLGDQADEDLPVTSVEPILKALFQVGDQLLRPEDEQTGFFAIGNVSLLVQIVVSLLRRLELASRGKCLIAASENALAVSVLAEFATFSAEEHGDGGTEPTVSESARLLTLPDYGVLQSRLLVAIISAAASGRLLDAPSFRRIVAWWIHLDQHEARRWAERIAADDATLVKLLERSMTWSTTYSGRDDAGRRQYRVNPKWLGQLLDTAVLQTRVKSLVGRGEWTELQLIALQEYIRGCEMIERGEDPDAPHRR